MNQGGTMCFDTSARTEYLSRILASTNNLLMPMRKMNCIVKNSRLVLTVMFVLIATLNGCSGRETLHEKDFVGKWKSSKVTTPVYLYENGEWEIMTNGGEVLQYGVWQITNNQIMWSTIIKDHYSDHFGHDINAILSVTPREFQLRESDQSITTFTRLD